MRCPVAAVMMDAGARWKLAGGPAAGRGCGLVAAVGGCWPVEGLPSPLGRGVPFFFFLSLGWEIVVVLPELL